MGLGIEEITENLRPRFIFKTNSHNILGKTHLDREENTDANILFKINKSVSKNVGKKDLVSGFIFISSSLNFSLRDNNAVRKW